MTLETDGFEQKAVLWAFSSYDDYGEPTLEAAAEVDVRWEQGRHEVSGPQDTVITADARVAVDREIAVGSEMWLGTLAAYNALTVAPTRYVVVNYSESPDVKGQEYRREVSVSKLSDRAPVLDT